MALVLSQSKPKMVITPLVTQSKHYLSGPKTQIEIQFILFVILRVAEFKTERFQVINGSLGQVLTTIEPTYDPQLIPILESSNPDGLMQRYETRTPE